MLRKAEDEYWLVAGNWTTAISLQRQAIYPYATTTVQALEKLQLFMVRTPSGCVYDDISFFSLSSFCFGSKMFRKKFWFFVLTNRDAPIVFERREIQIDLNNLSFRAET